MEQAAVSESAAHVLVVDDDDRIRTLLKRYLSDNGFRASVAEDAAEARRLMKGVDFDLLIVDVMMPGESGFDFTQSVRAASHVPATNGVPASLVQSTTSRFPERSPWTRSSS